MSKQLSTAVQSQHIQDFISHSAAQTIRFGQRLGELMRQGDLVVLLGDFGAGKTHMIKGIAQGLGSTDLVNSPSFVLINQYRSGPSHERMPIYHADLYRIEDPGELPGIGLEETWSADGVCLIEWPSRLEPYGYYPTEYLAIEITSPDADRENVRELRVSSVGAEHAKLAERLAQKLNV